jgi:predicted MFS family arabinose efflux permease
MNAIHTATTSAARSLVDSTFRSLRIRNYRLWFVGQGISQCGTWMQTVAQGWLVLQLSGSALDLGIAVALPFLPVLLLGTWGGLVADRADKRRVLIACQVAFLLQASFLAAIVIAGVTQVWMVWVLALVMGLVLVVDTPTRLSFVSEMVDADNVANAVGLNSVLITLARIVGPGLAGVLIAVVGLSLTFVLNPVLKVAVIVSLLRMRPADLHRQPPVEREPGQVAAGLRYAWRDPGLRIPLLLVAILGTFSYNFTVLLPLFAVDVLHQGGGTYGAMTAVMGAGALCGALIAATRRRPGNRLHLSAAVILGVSSVALAASSTLPVALVALLPLGAAGTLFTSVSVSVIQLRSALAMRGRVMALVSVVFYGSMPISGPLGGMLAARFGPAAALAFGGAAALLGAAGAAIALRRPRSATPVQTPPVGDSECPPGFPQAEAAAICQSRE